MLKLCSAAALSLSVLVAAAGCDAKEKAPPGETAPADATQRALWAYEQLRQALATDELPRVAEAATTLSASAQSAAAGAGVGGQKALFVSLSAAAAALSKTPLTDPDVVRKQYGEVSRALVQLLVAAPELRGQLKIFECPMAQGYHKWVQPGATIENPYMGKRMLDCGAASEWTVE